MSFIELTILMLINLLSFTIGAKIGLSISKMKNITLNPVKMVSDSINDRKERKEKDLEERIYDTMIENIDKYDGTGLGQKQMPKR